MNVTISYKETLLRDSVRWPNHQHTALTAYLDVFAVHNILLSLHHLPLLAAVQCLAACQGQQSVPLVVKAQQRQASEDDHHRVCVWAASTCM